MISEELFRNMALALMAVFIVTLIVLANIWACLLVFTCVGFTLVSGLQLLACALLGMYIISQVVLLSFTILCDWFKKSRAFHPTNQLQGNKPIATRSHAFSRSFCRSRVFFSLFHCRFILWFASAVIGY